MKLTQTLIPAAGLFAAVNAWGKTGTGYWTTIVTTAYTTYCPSPTTFVHSNVTYTATSETTLTITNCPCTVSVTQPPPVTTTISTDCPEETTYPGTGKPGPKPTGTGPKSYPTHGNGTTTVVTYTPPPTTYISGITPITSSQTPTKTPVGPSTTLPVTVPTAAAAKAGPIGAILAAGLAIMAL